MKNVWLIWSPLLYFNFKSFIHSNSSPFISFQCTLYDSGVLLPGFPNFIKLKTGDIISGGEPIFQNIWIISSPLLYLNLKSPMEPSSSSFIRFQSILQESGTLFRESWNFYKLKRGDLISGGEPILQNVWIIWSPLLYFNFKSFLDPNSSSFIRFQCILYESGVLLSEFSNLYKLKSGDLISVGNQFFRISGLFGPPFCI